MEKIFKQAILYDFYGELLTQHQRTVYEEAVYHDLSLSEMAEEHGISRQGVHDLIKRCDKILQGYEDKLHLVQKFSCARDKISEIITLTETDMESETNRNPEEYAGHIQERMRQIRELTLEITTELMKE